MDIKDIDTKKRPIILIDRLLDFFNDKILFPEKLEKANSSEAKSERDAQEDRSAKGRRACQRRRKKRIIAFYVKCLIILSFGCI